MLFFSRILATLMFFSILFLEVLPAEQAAEQMALTESAAIPCSPDEEEITFTPPAEWMAADSSLLPPSVKMMVIGKGSFEFPPSINLGCESFAGTLKQYLKRVKEINLSQKYDWKDLGMIRTQAGSVSFSQVDTKGKWGEVRLMHAIFKKNDFIFILTAAALKKEFSKFYKDFFSSICSLRFSNKEIAKISHLCDTLQQDDANTLPQLGVRS